MQFSSAVKTKFANIINANKQMLNVLKELTKDINHPNDLYKRSLTNAETRLTVAESNMQLLDVADVTNRALRMSRSPSLSKIKGGRRRLRTRRMRPRL